LSPQEVRVETVIQQLRLREGLSVGAYQARFGRTPRADYARTFDQLIARGLIEEDGEVVKPTSKGFALNNEIGLALVD